MYRMYVIYKFGRMSNEVEYVCATREECQAQIDAALDHNPALEYTIESEGTV